MLEVELAVLRHEGQPEAVRQSHEGQLEAVHRSLEGQVEAVRQSHEGQAEEGLQMALTQADLLTWEEEDPALAAAQSSAVAQGSVGRGDLTNYEGCSRQTRVNYCHPQHQN